MNSVRNMFSRVIMMEVYNDYFLKNNVKSILHSGGYLG